MIDRALTTREPVVIGDLHAAGGARRCRRSSATRGVRSVVTVVIDGPTRPFGVLGAMSERPHHFSEDDIAFLTAIANVLADAVERASAEREIADISAARGRLVAQAIDAEDRARRDISEALHDGALQELLAVRNVLFAMAGRGGDEEALASAQERLTAILAHLREVMSALHPTILHYGGLEAALRAVAEQEFAGREFEAQVEVEPDAAGAHDELAALARPRAARQRRPARGGEPGRRGRAPRAGRGGPLRRGRRRRVRARAPRGRARDGRHRASRRAASGSRRSAAACP